MAHKLMKEETPGIAIMDPYYMVEWILRSLEERGRVTKYVEDFLVAKKYKNLILVPYFPE